MLGLIALVCQPGAARAQLRIGLEYGRVAFYGGSEPATQADTAYLTPFGPDQLGARIAFTSHAWEFGLRGVYSRAGISGKLAGMDFMILDASGMKFYAVEPSVARRVASIGSSSQVWIEAGPVMNVWAIADEDPRFRTGAQSALTLRHSLSRKLDTNIRGQVGYSPTFVQQSDGIPDIEPTPVWRYGLSIGLDYKF